jgi:hypothetical protein
MRPVGALPLTGYGALNRWRSEASVRENRKAEDKPVSCHEIQNRARGNRDQGRGQVVEPQDSDQRCHRGQVAGNRHRAGCQVEASEPPHPS